MVNDVIQLIKEIKTCDALGVAHSERTSRQVFCQVQSVNATEFFEGGRSGLNPAYVFKIFFGDYDNEEIVEYKGQTYAVYRTYITRTDTLELYCERKGGTNGKQAQSNP